MCHQFNRLCSLLERSQLCYCWMCYCWMMSIDWWNYFPVAYSDQSRAVKKDHDQGESFYNIPLNSLYEGGAGTFLSSAYPRSDLVENLAIFFRQWNMSTKNINVILPHNSICSKIKCEVIHFSQSKSITVFYHIIIFFWIFLSLIFCFFFQYFSFEVIPFHLLLYHLRKLSWILSYFSTFLCVLKIHPCSPLNLNLFRLLH